MFNWKLGLQERTGIIQGVWDNFSGFPVTPQSLCGCCWDTLARAASMGQNREIWSGDVSYKPGTERTVGPPSRQRRLLILERRRQQWDVSINMPVCKSPIRNDPGNHELSINGFTTDDLEASPPSLAFPSSCVVIFWFFARLISAGHFTFYNPFLMCRFGTTDWRLLHGGLLLSVRCLLNSSLSPSLQQNRVRKLAEKLVGQDSLMKESKGHVWKQRT